MADWKKAVGSGPFRPPFGKRRRRCRTLRRVWRVPLPLELLYMLADFATSRAAGMLAFGKSGLSVPQNPGRN